MNGAELATALKSKGVKRLYHANSVQTSCSFLRLGGLASRSQVEVQALTQTEQPSDITDKECGLWPDIFMDTDDWHRAMFKRNLYGPVSFSFDIAYLAQLPSAIEVRVTKSNPYTATVEWSKDIPEADRWYATPEDVVASVRFSNRNQMVVVRSTPLIHFPPGIVEVELDNPKQEIASGVDAFTHAQECLHEAAKAGGVALIVREHEHLGIGCTCLAEYRAHAVVTKYFGCVQA